MVTETLAAILKGEPDWSALPTTMPSKLKDLLRRCPQKDPRERLHDIADARIEIRESETQPSEAVGVSRRFPFRWIAACATVLVLAGALVGAILMKYSQPAVSFPVARSVIKVEAGRWFSGIPEYMESQRPSHTAMTISGDGRFIVYSALEENHGPQAKPQLYLRRMDQEKANPIIGTEGGINPFLSRDNRWVGFWADGKLKKVPVDGGLAIPLCDALGIYGASWGPDNNIVFAGGVATGLSRLSADGGKPESLTTPDVKREESSHRLPSWLPNGKALLFTIMKDTWDPQPRLAVLRLDTHEWHVLLQDASDAKYVPTGHVVFLRQGTLMAVRFDPANLQVIGQSSPLVENVMQSLGAYFGDNNTGAGQFNIAESQKTGTLTGF